MFLFFCELTSRQDKGREGLTGCNLVTNSCEYEAESNEELGSARVEVGDDGWHVPVVILVGQSNKDLEGPGILPLKITPDVRMGGSYKYWRKSTKSAYVT